MLYNQCRVSFKNLSCLAIHLELFVLTKINATAYYTVLSPSPHFFLYVFFHLKKEIENTPPLEMLDIELAIEMVSVKYLYIPYFVPCISSP